MNAKHKADILLRIERHDRRLKGKLSKSKRKKIANARCKLMRSLDNAGPVKQPKLKWGKIFTEYSYVNNAWNEQAWYVEQKRIYAYQNRHGVLDTFWIMKSETEGHVVAAPDGPVDTTGLTEAYLIDHADVVRVGRNDLSDAFRSRPDLHERVMDLAEQRIPVRFYFTPSQEYYTIDHHSWTYRTS